MSFPISVTGVVLAGGQAQRMGGVDKGLIAYKGQPMACHVLQCFTDLNEVLINANRSFSEYKDFGYTLVEDQTHPEIEAYAGPLIGILSSLEHAANPWVLFSPCDTPDLPVNYAQRMIETAQENMAHAVVAHDGQRSQPLHILLNKNVTESLLMFLLSGQRKTQIWLESINVQQADFSDCPQAFLNFNRPEDLVRYQAGQS